MAFPIKTPRMLGQPVKRREDPRLITGAGQYLDDLHFPGMLHMAFVRSPYGHARVNGIDATEALKMPGVVAVVTAKDSRAPPPGRSRTSSAGSRSRTSTTWSAARSPPTRSATSAIRSPSSSPRPATPPATPPPLVEVDYDPLPAVVDPEKALEPGAPLLFEEFGTNLGHTQTQARGDVDGAFAAADKVVKIQVVNQRVIPAPMETRGASPSGGRTAPAAPAS